MSKLDHFKYNKGGQEIRVEPYYRTPYLKNTIYCILIFLMWIYVIDLAITALGEK